MTLGKYNEAMDGLRTTEAMRKRVLTGVAQGLASPASSSRGTVIPLRRYGVIAACAAVLILSAVGLRGAIQPGGMIREPQAEVTAQASLPPDPLPSPSPGQTPAGAVSPGISPGSSSPVEADLPGIPPPTPGVPPSASPDGEPVSPAPADPSQTPAAGTSPSPGSPAPAAPSQAVSPGPGDQAGESARPSSTQTPAPRPSSTQTPSARPSSTQTPAPRPSSTQTPSARPSATQTPSARPSSTQTPAQSPPPVEPPPASSQTPDSSGHPEPPETVDNPVEPGVPEGPGQAEAPGDVPGSPPESAECGSAQELSELVGFPVADLPLADRADEVQYSDAGGAAEIIYQVEDQQITYHVRPQAVQAPDVPEGDTLDIGGVQVTILGDGTGWTRAEWSEGSLFCTVTLEEPVSRAEMIALLEGTVRS